MLTKLLAVKTTFGRRNGEPSEEILVNLAGIQTVQQTSDPGVVLIVLQSGSAIRVEGSCASIIALYEKGMGRVATLGVEATHRAVEEIEMRLSGNILSEQSEASIMGGKGNA